jgi:hypothetical protein
MARLAANGEATDEQQAAARELIQEDALDISGKDYLDRLKGRGAVAVFGDQ